jgi:hypothetical protein
VVVIPIKYEAAGSPYRGLIPVLINGKRGFIDRRGREYFED